MGEKCDQTIDVLLQLPVGIWKDCRVAQRIRKNRNIFTYFLFRRNITHAQIRLQIGVRLIFSVFIVTVTNKLSAMTS